MQNYRFFSFMVGNINFKQYQAWFFYVYLCWDCDGLLCLNAEWYFLIIYIIIISEISSVMNIWHFLYEIVFSEHICIFIIFKTVLGLFYCNIFVVWSLQCLELILSLSLSTEVSVFRMLETNNCSFWNFWKVVFCI